MVKGTSKRVVVVKSPDPKIFEQAIFIVREDFLTRKGGRDMDILREAQKVADEYIKNSVANHEAIWSRIPSALYLVIGLLVSAGIWAAIFFLGMCFFSLVLWYEGILFSIGQSRVDLWIFLDII